MLGFVFFCKNWAKQKIIEWHDAIDKIEIFLTVEDTCSFSDHQLIKMINEKREGSFHYLLFLVPKKAPLVFSVSSFWKAFFVKIWVLGSLEKKFLSFSEIARFQIMSVWAQPVLHVSVACHVPVARMPDQYQKKIGYVNAEGVFFHRVKENEKKQGLLVLHGFEKESVEQIQTALVIQKEWNRVIQSRSAVFDIALKSMGWDPLRGFQLLIVYRIGSQKIRSVIELGQDFEGKNFFSLYDKRFLGRFMTAVEFLSQKGLRAKTLSAEHKRRVIVRM